VEAVSSAMKASFEKKDSLKKMRSHDVPMKSHQTIINQEIEQAGEELQRPVAGLLISGLLAGLGVGVSVLLIVVIMTLADDSVPYIVTAILVANAYSVGFILVIMGRMDLFTEYTTLALLPFLDREASFFLVGRMWMLVYVSNLVGCLVFAILIVILAPALKVAETDVFLSLAHEIVGHPWWVIVLSGSIAGWLMGLMSWLVTASRDTISQVLFVWLIGTTIGLARLHHAITGSLEVLAGMLAGASIILADFGYFLMWTTLGNIIGAVIFAVLIRFSVLMSSARHPEKGNGRHRGGR
jgi:formate-nitrite transporter family protein